MANLEELYTTAGEKRVAESQPPTTELKLKTSKSFHEINESNVESRRFMQFLDQEGNFDLTEAALKAQKNPRSLDLRTIKRLEAEREKFSVLRERIEEVIESFDPEMVEKLAASHPDFKAIAGFTGTENIKKILSRRLPELAIRDRSRCDRILDTMERMKNATKDFAEQEKSIRESLKRYNIRADDEVISLLLGDAPAKGKLDSLAEGRAMKDFKQNGSLIRKLFRRGPSDQNIADSKRNIEREVMDVVRNGRRAIENYKATLRVFRSQLGEVLTTSLMNDRQLNEAMIRITYGKENSIRDTLSLKEAGTTMEDFDEAEIKKKFESKRKDAIQKKRDSIIKNHHEKWTEEQAEIDYKSYCEKNSDKLNAEFEEYLEKNKKTPGNDAERGKFKREFEDNEFREKFNKQYKIPEPPKNLKGEWEATAQNETARSFEQGSQEYEDLLHNVADEYTDEKMEHTIKGKQANAVSDITKQFLNEGIINLF